jgi:hypothetical protein
MFAFDTKWLEPITKPIGNILEPVTKRIGGFLGHPKPRLYVHFSKRQLAWCIAGGNGQLEMMQVVCTAEIAHDDPHQTLIILDSYPNGARSEMGTTATHFVIPPETVVRETFASFSTPVIGKKGQPWTGRLVLVDQFKRKYKTERVTFQWAGAPPNVNQQK